MCRCAKISRSKNDISRISNARESIKALRSMSGALSLRLLELGWGMHEMATPDGMDACVTAIKDMNKGSLSSIDEMISRCDARISALQNELQRLEREDTEYHGI